MRLLRIEFENYAWRGIRLEGQLVGRSEGEPHEFEIGWHHSQQCWNVTDYYHFEEGPSTGKHFYVKTWEEVLLHFKDYPNNLPSFTKKVEEWVAEKIAEVI